MQTDPHPSLQEDLSMPMIEEEIDGLSGLLFPFYDADTHMLYLAGKVVGLGKTVSKWETPDLVRSSFLPCPSENQPNLCGYPREPSP